MFCDSHCSHGGCCDLDAGHKEDHNSGYCTWTDDEAVDKATADQIFRSKGVSKGLDAGTLDFIEWLT